MQRKDAAASRLRIYYGPDQDAETLRSPATQVETISVPAGELFPLLASAVRDGRAWLADFADDQLQIPLDLYEVLLAYQHYRRPLA